MKKIAALLMLVCIAMLPLTSLAATSVTWEEVGQPAVEKFELTGDFVALNDLGLAIWIPSDFVYTEPSAEDAQAGRYALFIDKDQECALTIDTVAVEGLTLDQALENAKNSGMFEPEIANINGLDAVTYKNESINAGTVVLVDTNSNAIIFSFAPVNTEVAEIAFGVISSSIMPLQ